MDAGWQILSPEDEVVYQKIQKWIGRFWIFVFLPVWVIFGIGAGLHSLGLF